MEAAVEKSAMRKIYMRLLPFAILSYVLAYIDRINVSFAGLTMRGDLHLSATDFGFALGTFFLGYFIFEVPSNVIMEKVGARIWIARIMITWGIFAGAMAFVYDTTSFSIVRFLLGVAEAGFFPGMLLYFTYWFPRRHHARIVSGFLVGLPVAVALGAPISTALLSLDGLFGLKGWQIMYIAEAIPTVVVGFLTLLVLTDRPAQAKFLTDRGEGVARGQARLRAPADEGRSFRRREGGRAEPDVRRHHHRESRRCCTSRRKSPRGSTRNSATCRLWWSSLIPYIFGAIGLLVWGRTADHNLWKAMINPKVLLLAVNYFGIVTASLGMLYLHPADHQVARQFLQHEGRLADDDPLYLRRHRHGGLGPHLRHDERAALEPARRLRALDRRSRARRLYDGHVVGAGRHVDGRGRVLRLEGAVLRHAADVPQRHGARGAGFAWINSIGNLGGIVGPWYVGYMKDLTGSFAGGLYGLALLSLIAALVCAFFLHIPDRAPEAEVEASVAGARA